jgi:hypothetical protein
LIVGRVSFFTGNMQGTYTWPDNPWDLKGC